MPWIFAISPQHYFTAMMISCDYVWDGNLLKNFTMPIKLLKEEGSSRGKGGSPVNSDHKANSLREFRQLCSETKKHTNINIPGGSREQESGEVDFVRYVLEVLSHLKRWKVPPVQIYLFVLFVNKMLSFYPACTGSPISLTLLSSTPSCIFLLCLSDFWDF